MSGPRVMWIPAVLALVSVPLIAAGTISVPLTVSERFGVARVGEPVLTGVPLPRAAQIFDPAGLAVIDGTSGAVVPSDRIVAARWGGAPDDVSKPIKWMWVAFAASVPASGGGSFVLTDYRPLAPGSAIALTEGASVWTVDTGAAQFEIVTSGFDLFHRVSVGGVELVSPSSTNGPYYTLGASTYRAASATGGSQITVYRQGANGQTLTLKVKGAHRSFAPGDATLSSDEDLDFNTFLTFSAGSSVVRVHHTVQNNRDWVPLVNNADFRNIGSGNSVWADEIGLSLGMNLGAIPLWRLATSPTAVPLSGSLGSTVSVYQDSSGDANWDYWRNLRGTGGAAVQDGAPTAAIVGGALATGTTETAVEFDGSLSTDPETPASALSYLWDFGDGVQATGPAVSHLFAEAGTYATRLWVGDGESVALAEQNVEITFVDHPPTAEAGVDREAPVGVVVLFDGSASSDPDGQALTCTWDFGDGGSATGVQATHAFAEAGVYAVTLSVSDGELADSDSLTMVVNPVSGSPTTVTLRNGDAGYSGTRDAHITGRGTNWNYGGCEQMIVGRTTAPDYNFLVFFDLSGIPAGARVDSATLTLTTSSGNYYPDRESQMQLYRVTPSWVEDPPGGPTCGYAGVAAVSWAFRDGTLSWTNAGGDFTDYATGSALLTVPAASGADLPISVDVTAPVQAWALGTPNHGLAAEGESNYQYSYFHSSEATAVEYRPQLSVTYTPTSSLLIFADSFEGGDTTEWTKVVP